MIGHRHMIDDVGCPNLDKCPCHLESGLQVGRVNGDMAGTLNGRWITSNSRAITVYNRTLLTILLRGFDATIPDVCIASDNAQGLPALAPNRKGGMRLLNGFGLAVRFIQLVVATLKVHDGFGPQLLNHLTRLS